VIRCEVRFSTFSQLDKNIQCACVCASFLTVMAEVWLSTPFLLTSRDTFICGRSTSVSFDPTTVSLTPPLNNSPTGMETL